MLLPSRAGTRGIGYQAQRLGQLPHEIINCTLGLELEPGEVYLSGKAHRHIANDHVADYRLVMDAIELAISEPTYVGQAPHHPRNIEVIKRVTVAEEGGVRRCYVLSLSVSNPMAGDVIASSQHTRLRRSK